MSLLPDYITENNYREAKTWFLESNICLTRAWIIFINTILHNQNDFHGSVEALQHSNELSIKSLYLLVGLDWEFGHNPAKNIDEVMDRYFEIFPSLNTNEIMNAYVEWMKEHGKELAKIHNWVIYGKLENARASCCTVSKDLPHPLHLHSFASSSFCSSNSSSNITESYARKRYFILKTFKKMRF